MVLMRSCNAAGWGTGLTLHTSREDAFEVGNPTTRVYVGSAYPGIHRGAVTPACTMETISLDTCVCVHILCSHWCSFRNPLFTHFMIF